MSSHFLRNGLRSRNIEDTHLQISGALIFQIEDSILNMCGRWIFTAPVIVTLRPDNRKSTLIYQLSLISPIVSSWMILLELVRDTEAPYFTRNMELLLLRRLTCILLIYVRAIAALIKKIVKKMLRPYDRSSLFLSRISQAESIHT